MWLVGRAVAGSACVVVGPTELEVVGEGVISDVFDMFGSSDSVGIIAEAASAAAWRDARMSGGRMGESIPQYRRFSMCAASSPLKKEEN